MRRIVCVVALVAGLAAVSAVPARAGSTLLAPGRTPPDVAGRYGIGLTTFTAADPARPGRTLTLDEWYPVAPTTTSGSPASLDLQVTDLALPGVRRDAEPVHGTRFPLVVFSHGHGGIRFQSWFLLEALAAHGYVVVAPDHADDMDPPPVVFQNRLRDISFAIDQALARSAAPTDLLAGTVDESRIAVTGFSDGGFTALAMAGGYQGWGPDERVDAIIPIAATPVSLVARHGTPELLAEPLAAIDVPALLLYGTANPDARPAETWRGISASPAAWRVDIRRAGHFSFTNICDQLAALQDVGLSPTPPLVSAAKNQGCGPKLIPIEKAHRITVQYVVAFLRTTIRHDAPARHLLSPQWAATQPPTGDGLRQGEGTSPSRVNGAYGVSHEERRRVATMGSRVA